MFSPKLCVLALLALVPGLPTGPARAAWSSDPTQNLPVADGAGDQVQPKVAPTDDGGCYISWFDAIGNGFDVRVQKLDADGDEVFAHNGVLVADRSFSSTQDYGLDVDASGSALLVFRDDRGTGIQITAARVSPTGVLLWGTTGVQLTATGDFVAAPKICGTGDGGAVVAWTQDVTSRIQKLDATGAPQWGSDVVLTPATGSYSVSDLHDAGTDAILGFVHQTGGFGTPRHLLAQKLDPSGAFLWGAGHVSVFDGGSLQFGNFPEFSPDALGGAVFSWYDAASLQLQCYAQHVLANGTEAFPHNGSAASTVTSRVRVSPSVAFEPTSGETFLFWKEQNSSQSQSGVYGQKFNAAGVRQWTDSGAVIVPVGTDDRNLVRTLTVGAGAFVFWSSAPGFGQDRLHGARVEGTGAIGIGPFDVSSVPSGKSRLDVGWSSSGYAILAWSDDRNDEGDVLAQNVNPDGTLGGPSIDVELPGPADGADDMPGFVGPPRPNPMHGAAWIPYVLRDAGDAIEIHDVHGRLVRTLDPDGLDPIGRVSWDGRDDRGRDVPAGVYFVRLASPGPGERSGAPARGARVTVVR